MMREIIDYLNEEIYMIESCLAVGARPSPTEILNTLNNTIKLAKQKQRQIEELKSKGERR